MMPAPIVDKYLRSVGNNLPEAQRDDIVRELSDNIESQIEDKESELGRSLRDVEVEEILRAHGHPLIVASRYRDDQRSIAFGRELVGPVIFPFYLRVLKFNLGITGIVMFLVCVAFAFSGHSVTVGSIIPVIFYQVVIQFVIVTAIFTAADRHWKRHPDRWDMTEVKHPWHPAFVLDGKFKSGSKSDSPRVSRFDSIAQIVALGITLVWLRIAEGAPFLIFGPAAAFLRPAPIWHHFYWPIVVIACLGILQAFINVLRPDWLRLMVVYRALTAAAWLVILYFVLRAGNWVVLAPDGPTAEGFRQTAAILNQISVYCVVGAAAVALYNFVRHLRGLIRLSSDPKTSQGRQPA
jgi:hypothetical protein